MADGPTKDDYVWPRRDSLPPKGLTADLGLPSVFNGMTLDEAYAYFCQAPQGREEDFMWMPEGGFRYYYPVIDRYLRSLEPITDEWEMFRPAWILAHCI